MVLVPEIKATSLYPLRRDTRERGHNGKYVDQESSALTCTVIDSELILGIFPICYFCLTD